MTLSQWLLLTSAISLGLGVLIRLSRQPPVELQDGSFLLHYPTSARVVFAIGALSALVAGIAGMVLAVRLPVPPPLRLAVVAAGLACLWLARWLWRERGVLVLVDDDGIRMRDWRGKHGMVAWGSVTELRWSPYSYCFCIDGRGGTRLLIRGMLQGVDRLLVAIRQHVPESHWRRWRQQIERYQQGRKARGG